MTIYHASVCGSMQSAILIYQNCVGQSVRRVEVLFSIHRRRRISQAQAKASMPGSIHPSIHVFISKMST